MEPILKRIEVVFHWMYVQPFILCTTIYVNERIYQNIIKTEMKVFGMIWNCVPKANHVGIDILSLGVYDAIGHFNDSAF